MAEYLYSDATINAFSDAWKAAAGNPGLQAEIHGQAEAYRKGLNSSYAGSVDGSSFVPATVRTSSPAPTGSPIEKASEHTPSGSPSEDNAPKSTTTVPSITADEADNVKLIQTAPEGVQAGKTINGVTLVAGNLLDTMTTWGNFVFGFVGQYAKPLLYIGFIVAISKVYSVRKK